MRNNQAITIQGTAHWSVHRQDDLLDSKTWVWWIEIEGVTRKDGKPLLTDEVMQRYSLQGERALHFIERIRPFIPQDLSSHLTLPESIPGGDTKLAIPMSEFSTPDQALRVLEEFFPELTSWNVD